MISLIKNLSELEQVQKYTAKSYALVPTMGNLHAGHLELVKTALEQYQTAFVSIFVNPLQFGPNEDFEQYPRTLETDMNKLETLASQFPEKNIYVFSPESTSMMYPDGHQTIIHNTEMSNKLCGKSRPGHFDGVCTVVYRLFKLIKPESAYFGLKDYQQVKVIERMNEDLLLGIQIKGCPIIRDQSGLALSSRNQYLSLEEKSEALILSNSLKKLADTLRGKNWIQAKDLTTREIQKIKDQENNFLKWDYLEVCHTKHLNSPEDHDTSFVILGAAYLGKTRLIDNFQVEGKH